MSRIPTTDVSGPYGAVVRWASRKQLGRVPESLGVMWHHRPVLRANLGFGQKMQRWDACPESLKTYAHMAVAAQVGCSWCLDFNYFMARDRDLDIAVAREVPRWRHSTVFTPLERAVLEYAEAATATPPTVTDEMVEGLVAQLGPSAVVELTTVIGYANLTARSNAALGLESEGFAEACGLPPLAEPAS